MIFQQVNYNLFNLTKNIQKFLLLVIVGLAIFFRFYQATVRYGIGGDSIRDAFVAVYGADKLQLPLTGPFSSLGPFTFGPWYYYQLIFFERLTYFSFSSWIYFSLASTFFIVVMYFLGKRLFDVNFGLIVALLAAVSGPQISTAKGLTNPNLIPIYAGISLLLFEKLFTANKLLLRWGFLFGFILGIGINIHYQMLNLLILPIILLVRPKTFRLALISFVGIAVSFIPLLLFDLNNHWYTIRNLIYYYHYGKLAVYVPNRWLFYLRDFWPSFWAFTLGLPKFASFLIVGGFSCLVGFRVIKKLFSGAFLAILVSFLFNFLILRYYWGERFMGYLYYLSPYVFLFTGFVLWSMLSHKFMKYPGVVILVVIVVAMIRTSLVEMRPDEFNLEIRKKTEKIITQFPPYQKFHLYNCKRYNWDQTQAIAYLLYSKGLLSDDGIIIGLPDNVCNYPVTDLVDIKSDIPVAKQLEIIFPKLSDAEVVNLNQASESAILAAEWGPVTPRAVYESTVRWWFHEQP